MGQSILELSIAQGERDQQSYFYEKKKHIRNVFSASQNHNVLWHILGSELVLI